MSKKLKAVFSKFLWEEAGQSLLIVLVLLVVGGLTLTPVLSFIGTSLKTGEVYEAKTDEFYAADSGIEDGIWQVKYNRLEALLNDPVY
ncbi:hypothetical protein ACFLXH_03465, partial [Chloroflexota bacterium]